MANAPHLAVRRAEYAADLGENGSGLFLIFRNCLLDMTSENQKRFARRAIASPVL
jgi:hypothetical protein